MNSLIKYVKLWFISARLSFRRIMANPVAGLIFLTGKGIRFSLFIFLITVLGGNIISLNGYSQTDLLLVYLVFNFFDSLGQLLFRGIYWFRQQIITGEFDFALIKPINPLFQVLTRETDLLDVPILIVTVIGIVWLAPALSLMEILLAIGVSLAALGLITAIHIAVAAFGILTAEVDHTMWLYRDISLMARFPVDMYSKAVKTVLLYLVPVGVIFTIPAKALAGSLDASLAAIACLISISAFAVAIRLWHVALKHYTSASS